MFKEKGWGKLNNIPYPVAIFILKIIITSKVINHLGFMFIKSFITYLVTNFSSSSVAKFINT